MNDKWMWVGWVASTTAGWLVSLFFSISSGIAAIDSHPASRDFPSPPQVTIQREIVFATIAGGVGLVQWLLLRMYIHRLSWWLPLWVLATAVGWTGVLMLADQSPPNLPPAIFWIIVTPVGVLQWLTLRPYIPRSSWWLLAHIASMGIVAVVVAVLPLVYLVAGTLYGIISGYALVSLVRGVYARDENAVQKVKGKWFWRDIGSLLLFFSLVAVILISYSYWRGLWYLSPPPPPIFDSAAAVIEKTVGGRSDNERYVLVLRFPPPAGGHQEQVVVLEGYGKAFREPVDEFFFTLRSAQLSQEQAQSLDGLRKRWCRQPPTFRPLQANEPFYDVGLWCSEAKEVKDIHVPVNELPAELDALKNVVAGPDTYK